MFCYRGDENPLLASCIAPEWQKLQTHDGLRGLFQLPEIGRRLQYQLAITGIFLIFYSSFLLIGIDSVRKTEGGWRPR